jgi:hypothetical protein
MADLLLPLARYHGPPNSPNLARFVAVNLARFVATPNATEADWLPSTKKSYFIQSR